MHYLISEGTNNGNSEPAFFDVCTRFIIEFFEGLKGISSQDLKSVL